MSSVVIQIVYHPTGIWRSGRLVPRSESVVHVDGRTRRVSALNTDELAALGYPLPEWRAMDRFCAVLRAAEPSRVGDPERV